MSIKSVMSANHLILCCPLLLLPSIFPSIRVFSNELVLCIGGQSIGASISPLDLLMSGSPIQNSCCLLPWGCPFPQEDSAQLESDTSSDPFTENLTIPSYMLSHCPPSRVLPPTSHPHPRKEQYISHVKFSSSLLFNLFYLCVLVR